MLHRSERRRRRRFWFEAALASATGLLFIVTLFWHDWLEAFGVNPDHGNGSAEWLVVAVFLLVCVGSTAVAKVEWRRTVTDSA